MSYQGPSVTIDDEHARKTAVQNNSRSSAWSEFRSRQCTILNFSENGNLVNVLTDDGLSYQGLRFGSPLQLINMFYGDFDEVENITGIIFYRSTPEEGFVLLGNIEEELEAENNRSRQVPFYL